MRFLSNFVRFVRNDHLECQVIPGLGRPSWMRSFFFVLFHYREVRSGYDDLD